MWFELLFCIVIHIYSVSTQSTEPRILSTDDLIPCERGWFYFKNKCYKLGGKKPSGRLNWDQASSKCISEGGQLVTIQSEELNEFLMTFLLLDAGDHAYIGLHDRDIESAYTWEDGSVVNYSNWEHLRPHENEWEDCVEMLFRVLSSVGPTGTWNDIPCTDSRAYICESKTSRKSSPDPRFCSDMQGGWKFQSSCYNIVSERKSWEDAEQHCQDIFSGHLVTILDFTVDLFLKYILSIFNRDVWIGMKIQEKYTQQWSSGWYVSFSQWDKDLGEDFISGTCALRSKNNLWRMVPCSGKYSFICERSSVNPPVLKPPVKGVQCPELPKNWLDFGGEYCYFIDTKSNINWYEANFQCMARGGSLASIHSEEESLILLRFVKYSQMYIFIGLHRLIAYENVFVWSDGSPLDFQDWDINEPNTEAEMCSCVRSSGMKFHDLHCTRTMGYICSVRKVSPNETETSSKSDCPISQNGAEFSSPSNCPTTVNGIETSSESNCSNSVPFEIIISVAACILLVFILIGIAIGLYCFRLGRKQERRHSSGIQRLAAVPPSDPPVFFRSDNVFFKDDGGFYEPMH